MTASFPFDVAPFDRLNEPERARLLASLDLAVFPAGYPVLPRDTAADALFVVARGSVNERQGGDVVAVHGPRSAFDVQALFGGTQTHSFVTAEETLCHVVPLEALTDLARDNRAFGSVLYQDFADKLRALARSRSNREMAALLMVRIRQAVLHPPLFVDAAATLRDAAAAMREHAATAVLVRDGGGDGTSDGGRVGILTGSNLRDLVILDGHATSEAVGPLARYDLLMLDRDELLLNALVIMTKHGVRRVVVTEDGVVAGLLEQIDVLGALSSHSQVIAHQIDQAETPEDLRKASLDTVGLIRALHSTGVKVSFIADLVTELNRKIFRKLYELLAPPDLLANSCLIVMGSEGRGEQLLKTDQDNGLILRDGFEFDGLEAVTAAFTGHLIAFGYPPCPGNIMVSNPEWTKPLAAYKDALFGWIHRPDEQAQMNLAIFFDAAPVAGDAALLTAAKRYLMAKLNDNQGFFANFARPALAFDTPTGLFAGLFDRRRDTIDIKKAGIFPIVHGIRALALEKHVTAANTTDRIWALADKGALDRRMAQELSDAFAFLSTLRLDAHADGDEAGTQTDNLVRPDAMSKLDRDQFNDCLGFVKSFKEFIAYHFHLNH